ncbi:MAG: hypothetical protein R3F65_14595 [bacterium]
MPAARAVAIAADVCAALSEAHGMGGSSIWRRGNLMLDRVGDEERVKVIDYGVAIESRGGAG